MNPHLLAPRRMSTTLVLCSQLAVFLSAPNAGAAPVDAPSAACRSAIGKTMSKLALGAMKAFDGCIKTALADAAGDCSTLVLADLKNKIPTLTNGLTAAIATCDDTAAAVALAEHQICSVVGGAAIASFADVAACLPNLTKSSVEQLRGLLHMPDFAAAGADAATGACIKAIAKNATKFFKTVVKVKSKARLKEDKAGADASYVDPGDPLGKIAAVGARASVAIDTACATLAAPNWADVQGCAADAGGAASCTIQRVQAAANAIAAAEFDEPGLCPSWLSLSFRGGAEGGVVSGVTDLDFGWPGLAHDVDSLDGGTIGFDVLCTSPSSCTSCPIETNCSEGNCRCANDNSVHCDEPFGPDADDCGGNDCSMFLGPPFPLPVDGFPLCVTTQLDEDATGVMSFGSGEISITAEMQRRAYLRESNTAPCPTCDGGFCSGGERNGLACNVDAQSDFGDVSYDCPPTLGGNLSGAGFVATVPLGTGPASLGFDLPCDAPIAHLSCACAVCSGDTTLPCNDDATCTLAAAGTCSSKGGGVARTPNQCNDLTCTDLGNEEGTCAAGPTDSYCDGTLKGNGEGSYNCGSNIDCTSSGVGGSCALTKVRPCFLDPIDAQGSAGVGSSVLASAFCSPPTLAAAVNGLLGLPGPVRIIQQADWEARCADDVTVWALGGVSCQ